MRKVIGALILIWWALLSHHDSFAWRSDVTLWADAVDRQPTNPRAWLNYGTALAQAGDWDGGAEAWERAWRASLARDVPTQRLIEAVIRLNLARKAEHDGNCPEAHAWLDSVIERFPDWRLSGAFAVCVW